MFNILKPKRSTYEFRAKEKTRWQRKVIKTTLGDLIVAVMDEVTSLVGDPSGRYLMASCVLDDLLTHHRRRVPKRSRRI